MVTRRTLVFAGAAASALALAFVFACNTAELETPNTILPPDDNLPPLCEAAPCDASADAPASEGGDDAAQDASETGTPDAAEAGSDAGPGDAADAGTG
jgi:hypothetical protein